MIAGTGAESTAETIERTKRAAALGYHAALVKTPHYLQAGLQTGSSHRTLPPVADEFSDPVLLYSVPVFTGVALESPEIVALAEHPNIVGIKDSSGNIQRVAEMIAGVPSAFQVLVGSAATIYPSLAIGAQGGILALASALPEKCVTLYELFRQGNHEKARELQKRLVRASKPIVSEMGIAGVKHVMDLRGYRGGVPRLPLPPLLPTKRRDLAILATIEPPIMASA